MEILLLGAVAMLCFTISLFFLRFWKTSHDRFFLFFALSFAIEGIHRVYLGLDRTPDLDHGTNEHGPLSYLMTLLSFLLIIYAIVDKNLLKSPPKK